MQKLAILLLLLVLTQCTYVHKGVIMEDKDHKSHKHTPIKHNASFFINKHLASFNSHLDVNEACAEEEVMTCIQAADPSELPTLQSQAQSLGSLGETPSEEDLNAKIEELEGDEVTGDTWTCVFDALEAHCESEFIFAKPSIMKHLSAFKQHLDMDEACAEEEVETCVQAADPSELEQLEAQGNSLSGLEGASEEEVIATLQGLESDPVTGDTWTCVFDALEAHCESEFIFVTPSKDFMNHLSTFKQHLELDEACAEEEVMNCVQAADPSELEQLQAQSQSLESELGATPSEEEINDKVEELESDEVTGDTWTCVFDALEAHCEAEF